MALRFVKPVAQAIGKLPTVMHAKLGHVAIHKGDETAFGEADGHFMLIDNIRTHIRNHDREETVYHESVDARLDATYRQNRAWQRAKSRWQVYLRLCCKWPNKEDLAESARFAWAMLVYLGRLPAPIEQRARGIMPTRLAFFDDLFLRKPIFYTIGKAQGCWDAMAKDNQILARKHCAKRAMQVCIFRIRLWLLYFVKLLTRTPFHPS